MFKFFVDDIEVKQVVSYKYSNSLLELSPQVDIVLTKNKQGETPIKYNSLCELYFDNVSLVKGYVDSLTVDTTTSGTIFGVSFRNAVQDFIDTKVLAKTFAKNTHISSIISYYGYSFEKEKGLRDLLKAEVQVQAGASPFGLIESSCKQLGIILDSHFKTIKLLKPVATSITKRTIDSNILTASTLRYSNNGGFKNIIAVNNGTAKNPQFTTYRLKNERFRNGRDFVFSPNESVETGSDLASACKWQSGLIKANTFNYSCTLNTAFDNLGDLFMPNRFYNINDQNKDINEPFLCKKVAITHDNDGFKASLELLRQDAYSDLISAKYKGINIYE